MKAILIPVLAVLATVAGAAPEPQPLPPATALELPRWRGFNLVDKFSVRRPRSPFLEEDFRVIRDWGFNFVRLPMDYRLWILDGDRNRFDERELKEIDQAVAWGETYGVHVMINLHKAPGYCINGDLDDPDLWTDTGMQEICALHWRTFARRYRGIPNDRLSFNLFNEPARVEPEAYLRVVRTMVEAIRAEDPDRLIVSDALMGADNTALAGPLRDMGLAFSPHQYYPGRVTHYKASWVERAGAWPEPAWPPAADNGILYSPEKKGFPTDPLKVTGDFEAGGTLRLHVDKVSRRALLVVAADAGEVLREDLVCGPGEGPWKEAVFEERWNMYQNIYDRDYTAEIPPGTREVTVRIEAGDWMRLTAVGFRARGSDREATLATDGAWAAPAATLRYLPAPDGGTLVGTVEDGRRILREHMDPWAAVQKQGVGIMIGEFGVFSPTPHDISLRWMEDTLAVFQERNWGWALWNLRGAFGVLDSKRADVDYEKFRGHKLDRRMLDLLRTY